MARSVDVVRIVLCSSNCCKIRIFSSSRAVCRMVGRGRGIVGLIERTMTGSASSPIVKTSGGVLLHDVCQCETCGFNGSIVSHSGKIQGPLRRARGSGSMVETRGIRVIGF